MARIKGWRLARANVNSCVNGLISDYYDLMINKDCSIHLLATWPITVWLNERKAKAVK